MTAKTYTLHQLAACAEREVGKRKWVYPGLIDRKKMTREKVDREIAMMEQIAAMLSAMAKAEGAKDDLFEREGG